MNTEWSCKLFNELTLLDLHDLIQLREKVFVVEQDCPYLDVDGKDIEAIHVIGKQEDLIIATSRILLPKVSYEEVSIGRVVVDPAVRSQGLGVDLMRVTMEQIEQRIGKVPIRISAQVYLIKYYQGFNFQQVGEPYLEDNIPHIQMLYQPKK